MKIVIGSMMHESNTFSCVPTDIDAFKRTQYLIGDELVKFHRGKKSELGGILDVFSKNSVEVIPSLSASAIPAAAVTGKAYKELKSMFLKTVKDHLNTIDGVLIVLHGAMIVEDVEDPEGDLLREIRKILPFDKPLAITLDHHAHLTETMVQNVDFLVAYRTHPHVDQYETGYTAAEILLRLIEENLKLTKSFVRIPLMVPGENNDVPRGKLITELKKLDQDPGVISSSIIISHPWGDISIQGDSVFVVTNNDQELANKYARILANKFWELRHDFPLDLYSLQQAVKIGLGTKEKGPVVICEMGDCILGGASGDIVTSVSFLLQRGIRGVVVAVIVDPESVKKAMKAGAGSAVELEVGGKLYRDANPPLSFKGKVKFVGKDVKTYEESLNVGWETSMGNMVVVEGYGVEMVLVEYAGKVDDPSFLESLGINPREKKFIILKTSIPPLVSYRNVASKILLVDTPGWCYQNLYSVNYKKVPRPMFPLDPLMEWSV